MSVIGFDIGNESCVIAAAKRCEIDVLLNNEAQRETPAMVSFGEKQRFIGSALATADPKSTISQIKRLIGKLYNQVQEELKLLPFVTCVGPRGGVLIQLDYLKQKWTFTPVEILGMLFTYLKQTAENNLESPVFECVIGIPAYFTDMQRRLYLDAAYIAGLKPLQLMHDGTAIALGYGMYKTDFYYPGQTIVMFVDIGHCDTQVTVAAFEHGKLSILSHSFDQNLGGRDFDEVLYKHFAAQFSENYNIDVCTNSRASVRLRMSCEKVKKVLSANAEAQISIECLIGDIDVRGVITREEFENLSSSLLQRVIVPCDMALKDSGLSVDQLYTIELVGSGSRIPAITRILTSFFQKEPTRTLNGSECVARGCALRCAMLSPTLHVRDYKVEDLFPYSIVLPVPSAERDCVLFPKGSPSPMEIIARYIGNTPLSFEVKYSNGTDFPAGISHVVGSYVIHGSESSDEKKMEVQLRISLNNHGIIEIGPARGVGHITYPWTIMTSSRMLNLPLSENLEVSTTHDELYDAQKKEEILAEQDLKVEQTKDQRNALESFVYDTRSKLSSPYKSFATDSEKEVIVNSLKETEEWLYEDSDDEYEQDYAGKFEDLRKLLEPIENKYHENARAKAEKALEACVASYREFANSLSASKKEKIKIQCIEAEHCLNSLDQYLSPAILSTSINEIIQVFESNCIYIIGSKPSFPRHDDTVGPDQRHQLVDSDQEEQPVDSDQGVQPVESDQGVQPVDSDQRVQRVDSNQREQPVDSNQRKQPVDSDQRDQPMDSDKGERPMDSDKGVQPVDSDQGVQPVDSDQMEQLVVPKVQLMDSDRMEQLVDSYQREQRLDSDQMKQHVDSDQREQPVDSDQWEHPVDSNQWVQPVDSDQVVQHLESDQGVRPVDSNKGVQSMDSDQGEQLVDSDQGVQPIVSNQREQPVDSDQRDQPVDSDQGAQPVNLDKGVQPVYSNQGVLPMDSDEGVLPVDSDKGLQPVDSDQGERLVDSDQGVQPIVSNQREQPVDSDQRDQPVNSDQGAQPVDFDKEVRPVYSDQGVLPVDSDEGVLPVDSDEGVLPVDSDKGLQSVDSDQGEQHVDSDQREQHVDSYQRGQHEDSDQREQHVDSDQREHCMDSNQTDQYVDSDQWEQSLDLDQSAQK